jgi:hypothetical protein
MAGVMAGLGLVGVYNEFVSILPFWAQKFINLFFISLVIVVYAIFIWKFYRWVSKKDILELNLNKYNTSTHSGMKKFMAVVFYFIEYLIILPIVVFIWFLGFTVFLMLLTENLNLSALLIISATILTAIRMTAYYKVDLSRDLAKLLPFTLLGVSITQFGTFSFENVLGHLSQIPNFIQEIAVYLLFIVIIEFFLRILDFLFVASGLHEEDEEVEEKKV